MGSRITYGRMKRMKRIQVQLPADVVERLRALSQQNRTSISRIVRSAVGDTLVNPVTAPLRRERWQRSLSAVGRFASDPDRSEELRRSP